MSKKENNIEAVIDFYKENQHRLIQFQASVEAFFSKHPKLNEKPFPTFQRKRKNEKKGFKSVS